MKARLLPLRTGHHIASWRDPACHAERQPEPQALHRYRPDRRARCSISSSMPTATRPSAPTIRTSGSAPRSSMRLEPLTLLGELSAVTSHIGLISTATTTYLDPFHVARMFATLGPDERRAASAGTWCTSSAASRSAELRPRGPRAARSSATSAPPSSSQVAQGLWDRGRMTPVSWTRMVACSSTLTSFTCFITRASTSRCAVP